MTRRALAGFILINVFVSIVVAIGIILIFNETNSDEPTVVTRVFPITVAGQQAVVDNSGQLPADAFQRTITALTATIDSQQDRNETLEAVLATAGLSQPTNTPRPNDPVNPNAGASVPTLPPEILEGVTLPPGVNPGGSNDSGDADTTDDSNATVADDGCIRYEVQSGDSCLLIAAEFEVENSALLSLNPEINSNCTNLIAGQEILIPSDACAPPPTPSLTPTATRTPFAIGTFSITNTPVPTATEAEVEIVQILSAGDINSEVVEIRNTNNAVVDVNGWILRDDDGVELVFPDTRLQPNQILRIFSRVSQNTPGALYWNQTVSVWEDGDTATLLDASGDIQSTYVVEAQTIDFGDE